MRENGLLLVLSGPSGVGKGTLAASLQKALPDMSLSVSVTTRSPRRGETNGVSYHFLSAAGFEALIKEDRLLEWAKVYGNYYGTLRESVTEVLNQGKDVLLEIDIQGAFQVKERLPEAILIFTVPPTLAELRRRLEGRATDSPAEIERRLGCFIDEIALAHKYDYIVKNDDMVLAEQKIRWIIEAERLRPERLRGFLKSFGGDNE